MFGRSKKKKRSRVNPKETQGDVGLFRINLCFNGQKRQDGPGVTSFRQKKTGIPRSLRFRCYCNYLCHRQMLYLPQCNKKNPPKTSKSQRRYFCVERLPATHLEEQGLCVGLLCCNIHECQATKLSSASSNKMNALGREHRSWVRLIMSEHWRSVDARESACFRWIG